MSLTWGASQAFRKAARMAAMSSGRKLYSLGAGFFGMIKALPSLQVADLQVCSAREQRVDCLVLTSEQMPWPRWKERIAIIGLAVADKRHPAAE
jgi:hypothetical protein